MEVIDFIPSWRGSQDPVTLYRNPGRRERLRLFNDNHKMVRFGISGRGDLYVGRAFDLLHADIRQHLRPIMRANLVYENVMFENPLSQWRLLNEVEQNWKSHDGEHENDAVMAHESRDRQIELAWLLANRNFKRFMLGMPMNVAPRLLTAPEAITNAGSLPDGEWYVFLQDDGQTYAFPFTRGLHNTEYPNMLYGGMRGFGGRLFLPENRFVVEWSSVSHPREFALSNTNAHELFAQTKFVIGSHHAIVATLPGED